MRRTPAVARPEARRQLEGDRTGDIGHDRASYEINASARGGRHADHEIRRRGRNLIGRRSAVSMAGIFWLFSGAAGGIDELLSGLLDVFAFAYGRWSGESRSSLSFVALTDLCADSAIASA